MASAITNVHQKSADKICDKKCNFVKTLTKPGRDLMRERVRSRIQDGGRQMRRVNTVLFLPFHQCFADTLYAMR